MTQKILLADDDEDFRMLLRDSIEERFEVSVMEASDGEAALAMMARGFTPDVVISDYKMPHVCGFELVERIRERGFSGSILILTGLEQEEPVKRGFDLGALDFFRKPIDERFYEALENALCLARMKWRVEAPGGKREAS